MTRAHRVLGIAALIGSIVGCGSSGSDGSSGSSGGSSSGSSGSGSGSSGGSASGCEGGACAKVTAVAAGGSQTCAILSGGTVKCWGANVYGQLGNGTSTGPETCADGSECSTTPVAVSGLSGVTAITAGQNYTCALLSGGTVECWGDDTWGELGSGAGAEADTCNSSACSTTPIAIVGLSGVSAVTAGSNYACALLSGGTVECWGFNDKGTLGNGSTTDSATPVAVSGLSGVTAIAAGADHTCALLAGGTVECWGNNIVGQLGNGTDTGPQTCDEAPCAMAPIAVPGLSGVTAISAGGNDTCALLSGGTVKCWGDNSSGELGNGATTGPQSCPGDNPCSTTPVAVTGLSGVTAISAGGGQACALLAHGTVAGGKTRPGSSVTG
jgi:alpha-tubulin suppressor-like RCC1 family protein